ncbi:hypothetical protein [Paenibacillus sp. 32352]|uniref:hypothetical protein n=1 Tax=Paenibacillus sp. 32352 TaxID=1969111 RepID=UPI002117D6BD|nr:hypothetical protein [Paenibacillus sp. 32352]
MRTYKEVIRESVPPSVQLLFENTKLDLTKTILLLYVYSLQSQKKYRKVSEIVFYYSLVNFDLIKLYKSNEENKDLISTNQYFRFQFNISRILLQLSQLGYIELKGTLTVKTDDIGARITPDGLAFVKELDSEYFTKLVDDYVQALKTVEFSTANLKIIKGGTQ